MSDMTRSKVDEVVYGSQSEEVPLETERLAEPHFQLPIRLSSKGLNDDGKIGASPAILTDSVGPDADDNSTSGSWQHIPTPNAAAPDEIDTQEAINRPRIFGLQPTYSDFYAAVKRGDTSSVKTMLSSGANIERQDDKGATALIIAIYAQQIAMIILLLEKGAHVHDPVINSPPIYHAVMQGPRAMEIIVPLVAHGADLKVTAGPTRLNPLHWAAAKGMLHAASFLISQGLDMEKRCLRGKTPLLLAAEKGHTNVIKLLLARGADLHARSGSGGTALTWAASNGHSEAVEYLVWEGGRVEDCDEDGTTALAIASISGHLTVVKQLLKYDADVNTRSIKPKDCTPAMGAANAGHTEVLQALISHGADLLVVPGDGVTTLEGAMRKGHLDTVKVLLKAIGGPDYPTESVALQMALAQSQPTMRSLMTTVSLMYPQVDSNTAISGDLAWMKWVLDQGGELVRPRALHNMLQAALFDGNVNMVETLLNLGADANNPVFTGDRPLHVAVGTCDKALVRVLLAAGADPALPSQDPKGDKLTPFHLALIDLDDDVEKDTTIVDLLLASGRCKLMEGENLRSTAFSFIVRRFDRWENGLAETIAYRMLDSIAEVNDDRADDGSTLMHVAVRHRNSNLVDTLLASNADINARDKKGYAPFLLAYQSELEFVDFLIQRGADAFAVNADGQGVLHLAAITGPAEAIDILLNLNLAEKGCLDIDAVEKSGCTPLISAIAAFQEEAALRLLSHGANITPRTSDSGRIALHYAARASMHAVVEKLMVDSKSVNTQDHTGWTPLLIACMASAPTTVNALLSQGADPEIANHAGDRPLHIALKRPLHMGPKDKRFGDPALELINHGVDIAARDAQERTPLHLAAQFHKLPAARLLLEKGASSSVADDKGQTPLSVCSNPILAELLLEHGADVNHTEDNGWTPLHHAVDRCWVKTFKVLVEAGADMHAKTTKDGWSAQERIEQMGGWVEWVRREEECMFEGVEREKQREAAMEKGL